MRRRRKLLALAAAAVLASAALAAGGSSSTRASTTLESISTTGEQGDLYSYGVGISGNGRFVVINSDGTNLVPGDTNDRMDVFVRDRQKGTTERVSVSSSGAQAEIADPLGLSLAGSEAISRDGRYVVFASDAPNLVPEDTNGARDVFLRDRRTGRTSRTSVTSQGLQANRWSEFASISADGRFVVFESGASNLAQGDTNGVPDVFLHDRVTGKTTRVSLSSKGRQANGPCEEPVISAHGRFVAYSSPASKLVRHDTNGLADVFVHDARTGKTTRVSVTSREKQSARSSTHTGSNDPAISADGRFVAFHSDASNLVQHDTNHVFDIFLRDRKAGKTSRVSVPNAARQADRESLIPVTISAHGRFVAFGSMASNLVRGDRNDIEDAFIRDRGRHTTILVSRSLTGGVGNNASGPGALSANGRVVAFSSWASNLVENDRNRLPDAFVRVFPRH